MQLTEAKYRSSDYDGGEMQSLTYGVDEPDVTPEQLQASIDGIFAIGSVRETELGKRLELGRDGRYTIPDTANGDYSGFESQSNHRVLLKKYPWLHTTGTCVCLDIDDAIESHGSFEDYLAHVPEDDWTSFLDDLDTITNEDGDRTLDEQDAQDIELKETERWMKEDGTPDLIKELMQRCDDGYERYQFSRITPELVFEWCSDTDHYPEREGEGGVYLNMKQVAEQVATHTWFLNHIPDDEAGWLAVQRFAYGFENVSVLFEAMFKTMAQTDAQVAAAYDRVDYNGHFSIFQEAFNTEDADDYAPYFYPWEVNGWDKPSVWVAGYDPRVYNEGYQSPNVWRTNYVEALEYLSKAEWFHRKVINWFNRPPEGHPELRFENVEDDPDAVNPAYISELPDRVDFLAGKLKAKTATQAEAVEYAVIQAESVLPIFEKEYPDDPRPRRAIEAANRWLRDPSEANRLAAFAGEGAYASAADAADTAAGAFATYAAAAAAFAAYAAAFAAYFLYWAEQAAYCAADAKKQAGIEESQEEDEVDDPAFVLGAASIHEQLVYEDDKIRVMSLDNLEALNYHLMGGGYPQIDSRSWEHFKYKDLLTILGKEPPDLTGHAPVRELGVLYGDEGGFQMYTNSRVRTALTDLFKLPEYGNSIHRMLIRHCREQVANDSAWGTALLQAGGMPELRRAERKGQIDASAFRIISTLQYIRRRQLAMAVKTLGRQPKTMSLDDVWLVFNSDTDLACLFNNEKYAGDILQGDTFDVYDTSHWEADLGDVIKLLDAATIKVIRALLVNRWCYFPDAGPEGQGDYILLTKTELSRYDDATMLGWIADSSDDDDYDTFGDIREALVDSGRDILRNTAEGKLTDTYRKAAVDALDGKKRAWDMFPSKKNDSTFCVLVPWNSISVWLEQDRENNGQYWEGSLEDLALTVLSGTVECPDANDIDVSFRDVDKGYAGDFFDPVHRLEAIDEPERKPHEVDDPKQIKLPLGEALEDDPDAVNPAYISELPDRVDFLAGKLKAKTCTKAEAVEYAIIQAESVLHLFEKDHPDDLRPRRAIEAANRWLRDPSEANSAAAEDAAYAAYAAASAAAYAAAYAAYAAAYAAAADFLYWAEQAADWATEAKKKAGIKESQEDDEVDDPACMPQLFSGIPVQFERQARLLIDDHARKNNTEASNVSFELFHKDHGYTDLLVRFMAPNWRDWGVWVHLIQELDVLIGRCFKEHRLHGSVFERQDRIDPLNGQLYMRFVLQEYTQAQRAADAALPF